MSPASWVVRPSGFSRAAFGLLLAAVLIGGMVIGSVVTGWPSRAMPQSTARPTLDQPQPRRLPAGDVPGEDLARLPRFPDAVRTGHTAGVDELHRLIEVSYLAAAELDDVRAFYRRVIVDHGWQRADLDLAGGEWVYILVDGATEAVIAMRRAGELVEIELELSEQVVLPAPTPLPPPALVAPPPVEGDGDGDGDGDD
jgi:hypothetical protein